MKTTKQIKEELEELNSIDDTSEKCDEQHCFNNLCKCYNQGRLEQHEKTLKARNQEIKELIENIDIEDFLGVYCYNANSLKNKILKEIKEKK